MERNDSILEYVDLGVEGFDNFMQWLIHGLNDAGHQKIAIGLFILILICKILKIILRSIIIILRSTCTG